MLPLPSGGTLLAPAPAPPDADTDEDDADRCAPMLVFGELADDALALALVEARVGTDEDDVVLSVRKYGCCWAVPSTPPPLRAGGDATRKSLKSTSSLLTPGLGPPNPANWPGEAPAPVPAFSASKLAKRGSR